MSRQGLQVLHGGESVRGGGGGLQRHGRAHGLRPGPAVPEQQLQAVRPVLPREGRLLRARWLSGTIRIVLYHPY